jgi:hypothetical protein
MNQSFDIEHERLTFDQPYYYEDRRIGVLARLKIINDFLDIKESIIGSRHATFISTTQIETD